MKTTILSLALVLLSFQMGGARDVPYSRSGLEASNYKTVRLRILGKGLDKIGLTEDRIRTRCELRLKQADLTQVASDDPFDIHLGIWVTIVGRAFSVNAAFIRPYWFLANDQEYFRVGPTWESNQLGTHANDPNNVIQALDELLGEFLNEYLKANAK
jgi:hypothetical protein